ncbi:hypothetical protein BDV24DRAFT_154677 [Aspergillus arachidicola]|uniref:NADH:ubiquinone reductase (non-electrogenic) n=1 Tax=Aspergillus arachidicola TaxID=656916 RepID=A0A5N6XVH6_9EURO|nr:hypothetical protein BDV24DRAFT_154677 [Aspergillus arachidicola]
MFRPRCMFQNRLLRPGSTCSSSWGSRLSASILPKNTRERRERFYHSTTRTDSTKLASRSYRLFLVTAVGYCGYLAWTVCSTEETAKPVTPATEKKNLVVLGTGWGSVSFLRDLDIDNYNVSVISPRNYFLFTPLLPSCTTGLVEEHSLMEPIRNFFKGKSAVAFYEAEATKVDPERRVVHIKRNPTTKGEVEQSEIPYDMMVVGVGADNATFNVPGVEEHSCFLKNASDSQKIRTRLTDCIEAALYKGRSSDEIQKLLHFVVVGGGPTGVEFAAELQDYYKDSLRDRYPEIMDAFRITLIEKLPNVLPMFSKQLTDYTESALKSEAIDVLTNASVKEVGEDGIKVEVTKPDGSKDIQAIPYGLLVWAAGNKQKGLIQNLASRLKGQQDSRRGLVVDDCLAVQGAQNIWAFGDCANSELPPTAQVAHQQGSYLAKVFNEMACTPSWGRAEIQPFDYNHQGAMAYIGMDKAVADLNILGRNVASHGFFTFLFWKAAYLNMCLSGRSRFLVATDWMKARVFGRNMFRE